MSTLKLSFLFFVLFFAAFSQPGFGQKLQLYGRVTDKAEKGPLPYATVRLRDTLVGTVTTVDGNYRLTSDLSEAVLEVSMVGFTKKSIEVKATGQPQKFDFVLEEELFSLEEVVIRPGERANYIMRNLVANKSKNNHALFPEWVSRIYSKIEIDLKNVKRPEKERGIWKQIDFVFDHIDTLATDGKTFLPVFITESVSDLYHMQDGKVHEKIVASKVSGMQTGMVTEFTGQLYTNPDPYSNFFEMSDVALISPLHDAGTTFYRYSLRDSSMLNGHKVFEIAFYPKNKMDPAFKGKVWVVDSTFAVTRIEMRLSEAANVNFLRDLVFERDYSHQDEVWIPKKESLWIDFNIQKKKDGKLIGLIGRKSTVYNDFTFAPAPRAILKQQKNISLSVTADQYDDQAWDTIRPIGLQEREAAIYSMVDSLKNIPVVKTVFDYIQMFFFGYKEFNKFEIGPYYYMLSSNQVEGNRFRLGGRTTLAFHDKLRLNGYLAYGLKDEDFKYSAGAEYFFKKDRRFSIEAQYEHDYQLLGRSANALMEDNILTSVLSKQPMSKLNMVDRYTFRTDKEWSGVLSNYLIFKYEDIHSSEFVPFYDPLFNRIESLSNAEVSLNTRVAFGEQWVLGNYEKTRFGSTYPIIQLETAVGLNGILESGYSYFKVNLNLTDRLHFSPFGYTSYRIQAGRIWGDLPFPLLRIHEGNETYAFDSQAFNLMNYQERISDRYALIVAEQHFQGYFFNRIPILRKLKWREVVGGRCLFADLGPSGHDDLVFTPGMQASAGKPYAEVNVGIENIFRLLRVDSVWRLTDNEGPHDRFSLFLSVQFSL